MSSNMAQRPLSNGLAGSIATLLLYAERYMKLLYRGQKSRQDWANLTQRDCSFNERKNPAEGFKQTCLENEAALTTQVNSATASLPRKSSGQKTCVRTAI